MTETIPPPERFHEHSNLTLTGAPTANGFEIYLVNFDFALHC